MAKKITKKTISTLEPAVATVLVLRTCNSDMTSNEGFRWPTSGPISAPDWSSVPVCGHGLHGLLWGEGKGDLLNFGEEAKWLVCRVPADQIVDLGGKVKFPSCEVIHCGDQKSATEFIRANGAAGRAVVGGVATAGDMGVATAGYRGVATAGDGGVIAIWHWSDNRYKIRIAQVIKDEDGDGDLEPNTPYRLNNEGYFLKIPKSEVKTTRESE